MSYQKPWSVPYYAAVIKPVIATIERGLVIRQLGKLGEKDRGMLAESLKTILG